MPENPKDLLRPEDLAELLGWNVGSVRHALLAGRLPGVKIGRRWFIRRADFDGMLERQAQEREAKQQAARAEAGAWLQEQKEADRKRAEEAQQAGQTE